MVVSTITLISLVVGLNYAKPRILMLLCKLHAFVFSLFDSISVANVVLSSWQEYFLGHMQTVDITVLKNEIEYGTGTS